MANAANLINFGSSGLSVGDWTYSAYSLTTPSYLPLNDDTVSYLASSYPTLAALYTTPVTAYSAAARTLPSTNGWIEVAFGNGIFVTISQTASKSIATSTDGINWTARDIWLGGNGGGGTTSAFLNGIYFANGIFVVTAYSANDTSVGTQVFTSVDGINWNYRVITPTSTLTQWPIYGNGAWVLYTSGSTWYRSTDNGVTWIAFQPTNAATYSGRAYGAGKFVVGGFNTSTACIKYSTNNGLSWTNASTPNAQLGSIAYGNGVFVAVDISGTPGTIAASSPDAITWTLRTLPSSSTWRSVPFGNGVFVALSSTSTNAATSADGIAWVARALPTASGVWYGLCIGGPTNNKFFVAVASSTTNALNINLSVAQTNFSLPAVPLIQNTIPYIKAT